jgi:sugar phosphate isomerase/epimerase
MEVIPMEYGLQLYSVRDITPTDLAAALRAVKAAGYSYVEFAGFFGHTASDVARMLADTGLGASGSHTGLAELTGDYDGVVAFHKAIGCGNLIIPWHDLSTQERIADFIATVSELQPRLSKDGITLSYHNHAHEFTGGIYTRIIESTGLSMELDTFWAYAAGQDPVALMEKLRGRLCFIHLKDGLRTGDGRPLGMGEAPVRAVWEKAVQMGIPMVVESETLTPDGLTEAVICMRYLQALSN